MIAARGQTARTTDAELVTAAKAGENAAFAEIYQRNADRVFGLVTRILGPVDARDDVTQEIFVQLYRALPSFREESRLSTFLYRIAVRAAVTHARRHRGQRQPFDAAAVDSCLSPGSSPLEHARDRQELEQAFEVIGHLKPERRAAFVLSVVEGMSYDEVGQILEISADAAKQRTLRARRDIRRQLDRRESRQPIRRPR